MKDSPSTTTDPYEKQWVLFPLDLTVPRGNTEGLGETKLTVSLVASNQVLIASVADDPEYCIGTTMPYIDTPNILLSFGSILYHLGKLVFTVLTVSKR